MDPVRPPVVVIAGPTAAGKSAVALELAERLGGEIVNADSVQVYRFMDVGTAKPSLADRRRVPHHLIDVVTPDVEYSAGRFGGEARRAAAAIHARGRVVLLVGGTGLYIRAFLEGLIEGVGRQPALRSRLEREAGQAREAGDAGRLHRQLAALDPEAAQHIHPNDVRRTVRALEIQLSTGALTSRLRARHHFADRPYRVLHLVLDPGAAALGARIDARARAMIEGGLLQETRALHERGYGPELRSMQAIGYRHMAPVVAGSDTLANALAAMQRDTRQLARRQRTWFRAVRDAVWEHPDAREAIAARVARFLEDGKRTRPGRGEEPVRPALEGVQSPGET
jgi:tRNA dimethylallyltransferase